MGPKMKIVVDYVRRNPGCSKLEAGRAQWGWRLGCMRYVYDPVNRAINAGHITAIRTRSGRYKLYAEEG